MISRSVSLFVAEVVGSVRPVTGELGRTRVPFPNLAAVARVRGTLEERNEEPMTVPESRKSVDRAASA